VIWPDTGMSSGVGTARGSKGEPQTQSKVGNTL
jgi:hypothetical protein